MVSSADGGSGIMWKGKRRSSSTPRKAAATSSRLSRATGKPAAEGDGRPLKQEPAGPSVGVRRSTGGLSKLTTQQLEAAARQGRIDTGVLGQLRAASDAAVQALEAALEHLPRT